MHDLVLFCKTYAGDIKRFKILKASIDKFNTDSIPFYVVCPQEDKELFKRLETKNEDYSYNILTDEEILGISKDHEQNWYTQQVIKLAFYKTNVYKHYLSLDSDCYFIREFHINDYIYDSETPYIPLTEPMKGAEVNFMQLFRALESKDEEAKWNSVSKNYLKRTGKRFCLNVPPVMSVKVLEHMETNFLKPNNLTFKQLIEISPYEYEWYCDYLLKYNPINYIVCTPFFVSFYNNTFYLLYRFLGFTEDILANYYTGVIMHEGWVKDKKFKKSLTGSIVRKIIQIIYYANKDKKSKEKLTLKQKYRNFRYKFFKYPLKVLFGKSFKNKPLIVIVYCGKGWILHKMAIEIKKVLQREYNCIIAYSGHLQKDPAFFKALPVAGYCNVVCMDTDMKNILKGNEVFVSSVHHWVDERAYQLMYQNFKNSQYLITDSNEYKNKLIQKGITIPIKTMHAFVPKVFWKKQKPKLNKNKNKITLGYFGMIHADDELDRKGTRHLIKLMEYIKGKNLQDKFELILSGGGWESVIKHIKNLGINVQYYSSLASQDMPHLYKILDFYVMLSDIEGGPVSVIEAMASKVMVLSNKIGLAADLGENRKNLVFIQNDNPEQILNEIEYYNKNKQEYENIVNNAFQLAKAYTPENIYSKYISIFNKLIDKTQDNYSAKIDLNKIQKVCNTYGKSILPGSFRLGYKYQKVIFKPILRIAKNFIPNGRIRENIKNLYKF